MEGLGSAASSYDNAYNKAEAAYNNWAQRNPNAAEAAGVAGTVVKYAADRVTGKASKTPQRGTFRKKTIENAWSSAKDGSQPNTKQCPTCGKDVRGNPYNKESRNTKDGWDASHNPSWSNRNHSSDRKQQLDNYNQGVGLECRHCNRSGKNNDERFKK